MKILCVGDVVGAPGLRFAADRLPGLRRDTGADLVVANAENCDKTGTGLRREDAETLLQYADVLTGGNHSYDRADERLYTDYERVLHPANVPFTEDAAGCCLLDMGRLGTVRVVSLSGVAWMQNLDNPFVRMDKLLAKNDAKYTVIDMHAESTAEKKALAFYLDGRVSAIYGTHTHVQTADEQILPKGTGFISDVGMTGPVLGVLGMRPDEAIQRMRELKRTRLEVAEGPVMLNAVLFTLSDETGLCLEVRRIDLRQSPP